MSKLKDIEKILITTDKMERVGNRKEIDFRACAYDAIKEAVQLSERVEDTLKRNKELEHASKYNGELNEFLQKRKLPPNTLGKHVVDVAMDYVEELEKEIEGRKKFELGTASNLKNLRELNERRKQALEFYADTRSYEPRPHIKFDRGKKARQALKGESK